MSALSNAEYPENHFAACPVSKRCCFWGVCLFDYFAGGFTLHPCKISLFLHNLTLSRGTQGIWLSARCRTSHPHVHSIHIIIIALWNRWWWWILGNLRIFLRAALMGVRGGVSVCMRSWMSVSVRSMCSCFCCGVWSASGDLEVLV